MKTVFRCLAADVSKTKRLSFRTAHLVIPVCAAGVFLAYYVTAPWSPQDKTVAYFQTLGVAFPILTGLFCAMLAEQELSAASFQNLLSYPEKLPLFYSKLLLLVVYGAFSVLLAGVLFGAGNILLIKQSLTGMGFYLSAALVLLAGNILLYVFHWFLALRFNKGISIMIGIAESLAAALLLTGLGEKIWCYVPCAWGPGLVSSLPGIYTGEQTPDREWAIAISLCIILTVCAVSLFGIWAARWEGQHTGD